MDVVCDVYPRLCGPENAESAGSAGLPDRAGPLKLEHPADRVFLVGPPGGGDPTPRPGQPGRPGQASGPRSAGPAGPAGAGCPPPRWVGWMHAVHGVHPARPAGGRGPPPVVLAVRPGWPARPGQSGVPTRHALYTGSPCAWSPGSDGVEWSPAESHGSGRSGRSRAELAGVGWNRCVEQVGAAGSLGESLSVPPPPFSLNSIVRPASGPRPLSFPPGVRSWRE
eukprot:gene25302-biopygen20964